MVRVVRGDIFESEAQTLVNTVNCVGVMGKGIALGFKKRFPVMYEDYARRCERGELRLGRPYVYRSLLPPWILNFPTKDHWRSLASLRAIVEGLDYLADHYQKWGITSLAVPPLGCGEGKLDWMTVGRTLYRHLNQLEIPVDLYAPYDAPATQLEPKFLANGEDDVAAVSSADAQRIPAAHVALAEILARIGGEQFRSRVGRTMFQKIAYFATEAGIPTGLEWERGSYGPFAPTLQRISAALVNNGLVVEERQGQMFVLSAGPTLADVERHEADDLAKWGDAIERVVDLFVRLDTRQSEVAATVHYAAMRLSEKARAHSLRRPTEAEVVDEVERWKARRDPAFVPDEIASAVRHLNVLGWMSLQPSESMKLEGDELDLIGA